VHQNRLSPLSRFFQPFPASQLLAGQLFWVFSIRLFRQKLIKTFRQRLHNYPFHYCCNFSGIRFRILFGEKTNKKSGSR
jgi:hypothetical protein